MFEKIANAVRDMGKTKQCKGCKKEIKYSALKKNNMICPECGAYFRMNPSERIALICDEFTECDKELTGKDVLQFPGYEKKLEESKKSSSCCEAVTCGYAKIGKCEAMVFVMNSEFMMGSMGSAVGEKITRLFESATKKGLPVIGFTASGGARMQEGIFSLMQMAKVSGAVKRHSDKGLLYITVLTDPTTGGVTASFAMEGDIIIAEPKALVGFAGARVIEQTTGEKLPAGFQRAEFILQHGFADMIVKREDLKEEISKILEIHLQ